MRQHDEATDPYATGDEAERLFRDRARINAILAAIGLTIAAFLVLDLQS